MSKTASYILSAYSFLFEHLIDKVLDVGYQAKNGNPIPSFDEELLIDLCSESQSLFEKESNVLELSGDFIIVGDIHGSLHDLFRILKFLQENNSKALFLGDYVDRGNFSLECITILLALKILYPDSIFLLRGNHEFDNICSQYGFKDEILNYHNPKKLTKSSNNQKKSSNEKDQEHADQYDKYYAEFKHEDCYKYTELLYNAFLDVFSYLPICAVINKTTFCIHGGLSPKIDHIGHLSELICRPIHNFDENIILSDVVWSDPADYSSCCFDDNPRGRGCLFNYEAAINFLKKSSLTRMIRAHQCVVNGSLYHFGDKCITVFSASSYDSYMGNNSAILQLFQKDDSILVQTFSPLIRLEKIDASYYKVQSLNLSDDKIKFCFSLLHPTLLVSSSIRMTPVKRANIRSQKSDSLIALQRNPKKRLTPLNKQKFITNPRRSCQFARNPLLDII
ncbi:hypothetical protein M9Y10_027901 [Tritrichomonas musculus]|uniref:Serine/threonine-protein phosphatase n=1 Tax=Tritrichomonas musculus TaxID=1915356 RepID=A0ABR2H4A3_9EUKA